MLEQVGPVRQPALVAKQLGRPLHALFQCAQCLGGKVARGATLPPALWQYLLAAESKPRRSTALLNVTLNVESIVGE